MAQMTTSIRHQDWWQNEILKQKQTALYGTQGWCRPQNRNLRWPEPDTILQLKARRERLMRVHRRWPSLTRAAVERRRQVEAEMRERRVILVPRALVKVEEIRPAPPVTKPLPTVIYLPAHMGANVFRRLARYIATLIEENKGYVWRNSAPRGVASGLFTIGTPAHRYAVDIVGSIVKVTEYRLYTTVDEQEFSVPIRREELIALIDRLEKRYRNRKAARIVKPPRLTEQRRFMEDLQKELLRLPVGVLSVRHTLDRSVIESERGGRMEICITPTGVSIDSLAHYAFVPVEESWLRDVVTKAVARQNATASCNSFRQGIPAAAVN
jgi:hypothetical protein